MSQAHSGLLKASVVSSGASVLLMVVGLVATKLLANFLGPAGLAEWKILQNLLIFAGFVIGIGAGNSAVRSVAEALGSGDRELAGRLVWAYRRWSAICGIAGGILMAALAHPLGVLAFGSPGHGGQVAILSTALFLSALQAGQVLPLYAFRQVVTSAQLNLAMAILAAASVVGSTAIWGIDGLVPGMALGALGSYVVARKAGSAIEPGVPSSGRFLWQCVGEWVRIGFPLLCVDLMSQGLSLLTAVIVVHEIGLVGSGIYLAAWGLSSIFVGMVVAAMAGDFFPRLAACARDSVAMSKLVNYQIEVGVLVSLPGVLALVTFADLAVAAVYSQEFASAVGPLRWFTVFAFLRIISTPIYYAFPAVGAGALSLGVQLVAHASQLVGAMVGLYVSGLDGMGVGVTCSGILTTLVFGLVAYRKLGYVVSRDVIQLSAVTATMLSASMAAALLPLGSWLQLFIGLSVLLLACAASLRGLASRLGPEHRVARLLVACKMPNWLIGARS